jgi:dTDP-4-dehydrorhamnose reductase
LSIIVNAAAYTDVDRAESEAALAHAVNATAPAVMAEEARNIGALLVHYSTAFVFDGAASKPYVETDTPNPLGEYGRSKLAGEDAIRSAGGDHLILRTNWVYDARGRNFATTLMRLARERDELRVVADQVGTPTWAETVARATAELLTNESRARAAPGIYHLTALGSAPRDRWAVRLFDLAARRHGAPMPAVVPLSSAAYPTAARRPPNSVLNVTRIREVFGLNLPRWEDALAQCVDAWDPQHSAQ